jgi:hypothetical protein
MWELNKRGLAAAAGKKIFCGGDVVFEGRPMSDCGG